MKTSLQTDKIFPLLFKAKQQFEGIKKDTSNPFFKSKYATLNNHLEEVEPILEALGLMLLQPVVMDASGIAHVDTQIIDSQSGQFVSSQMPLLATKQNDMQALGSAVTYARRFTLGALLSLMAVDDDGEDSVRGPAPSKTNSAPVKVSAPVTKLVAPQATSEAKPTTTVTGAFKKPGAASSAPVTNGVAKKPNPVTDSEWT